MKKYILLFVFCAFTSLMAAQNLPKSYSGIYPTLSSSNLEGECGTGAVVPWAGRLWVITYGPHKAFGSTDKLYEINESLEMTVRPESIGGTPANRMIHKESNQLFIGPYVIDAEGNVKVIPVSDMPGRLTGIARSVKNPAGEVVIATMEEGFYGVDVNTLKVDTWFEDGNVMKQKGLQTSYESDLLEGVHGKGFYSGQGVYVFTNNGEGTDEAKRNPKVTAGVLAEYDGKAWKQVRRNQFTEITGPGGIYGNPNPDKDPLWALGWDYKSVILAVREPRDGWHFFRLPKASNSYDGAHGWNTEWPRIRNVGTEEEPYYLMTMHGMFWHFPQNFTSRSCAGLRPLSSYLKVIGDFCSWNGHLVFGCDDTARNEFLNKRKAKGGLPGPGQSQSNLWFTSFDQPANTGTLDAVGSVWQQETVKAGSVSEPMLIAGWQQATLWLGNEGKKPVKLAVEVDKKGNGSYAKVATVQLTAGAAKSIDLAKIKGEWVRVRTYQTSELNATFVFGDTRERSGENSPIFAGINKYDVKSFKGGLLNDLGDERLKLGIAANEYSEDGVKPLGFYTLDAQMNLLKRESESDDFFIRNRIAIPEMAVKPEKGSYLVVDDSGRRWRLPLGRPEYDAMMQKKCTRMCREVATERDLFNCAGTFYELPAENADGFAKIRPVCTHNLLVNDYASFRGLMVMTGIDDNAVNDGHIIRSEDGKCSVWAGSIDDLWKLGKPVGHGGPWLDSEVEAGETSDPYLIGYYDRKTLTLSHKASVEVEFTVELDPTGDGTWMKYASYKVQPGQSFTTELPRGMFARWIRFSANASTTVSAVLNYE